MLAGGIEERCKFRYRGLERSPKTPTLFALKNLRKQRNKVALRRPLNYTRTIARVPAVQKKPGYYTVVDGPMPSPDNRYVFLILRSFDP